MTRHSFSSARVVSEIGSKEGRAAAGMKMSSSRVAEEMGK